MSDDYGYGRYEEAYGDEGDEPQDGDPIPAEPEPHKIEMVRAVGTNVVKLSRLFGLTVGRAMELEPSITSADVLVALQSAFMGFARTMIYDKLTEDNNPQGAYINALVVKKTLDEIRAEIDSWGIPEPESETTKD